MPKTVYVVSYMTNLQDAHTSVYTDYVTALIGYAEGKSALAHIVRAAGQDTSGYSAYQQKLDEHGMQFVIINGENTVGMCQLQAASLFTPVCKIIKKSVKRAKKRSKKAKD